MALDRVARPDVGRVQIDDTTHGRVAGVVPFAEIPESGRSASQTTRGCVWAGASTPRGKGASTRASMRPLEIGFRLVR